VATLPHQGGLDVCMRPPEKSIADQFSGPAMKNHSPPSIAVAGHICLDIIPAFGNIPDLGNLFVPGTLAEIGPAVLAAGGVTANTGLALHKLGLPVLLMAKIGDDDFGKIVLDILKRQGAPTSGMIVAPGGHTSYTLVINPPGIDRMFLHCPGTNHTFCPDDIDYEALDHTAVFHFGYPPLMRRMFERNGQDMKTVFERIRRKGIRTSLDMTCVDPVSEAGRIDWFRWLENVLPSVDLFLPSIDEILFMVNRPLYDALVQKHGGDLIDGIDAAVVEQTAQTLTDLGVSVVMIKLGNQGIYLRTSGAVPDTGRAWRNVSLFRPCFQADVVGTTGAGDCTIAGFLAAFVKGCSPQQTADAACAVGGYSTEAAGATDSVPHWDTVQDRMSTHWKRRDSQFARCKGMRE
jgi:sugar/nucleoside kinase (ribokinase family)